MIITRTKAAHLDEIFIIDSESFSKPWSKSAMLEELSHKHAVCLAALDCGKVIGHITMRHVVNEGHISNIAVSAAFRKIGVGSKLLEALFIEAISREMIGLTLEVRAGNKPALALYKKHGFKEEGRRRNFYSLPTEDAIIMWKMF